MKSRINSTSGFSLIEMLIAMAIFAVVATSIIGSYQSQQYSYIKQEKVAEAQQNIRAAMFFLERDIRRFGYDPSERAAAATSISMIARPMEIQFVWDSNENGIIENSEIVRYLLGATDPPDSIVAVTDPTGKCPANTECSLKRATGPTLSPDSIDSIADHVEALEFFYHFADGTTATTCTTQAQRENIRSVDISILVRSKDGLRLQKDAAVYHTASGAAWGPYNDNHVRRMMISNIKCRNMGLEG